MNIIDYDVATDEEICTQALVFTEACDLNSFDKLLEGVRKRKNYLQFEKTICNALLQHDYITMYLHAFEEEYLSNWCQKNMDYMLQHCHDTFTYWTTESPASFGPKLALIADTLSSMPISDCLRVLRGQIDEPFVGYSSLNAQKMLHSSLMEHAASWNNVAPYWVSTPELREAAVVMGWETKYLPAMVHRNIWKPGSAKWLPSVNYPYTLMACEMHRYAQEFGALWPLFGFLTPVAPEIVACAPTTSAVDIAMAEQIISCTPHVQATVFILPNSVRPLSNETEKRIEGLIQAHVVMDTLNDLALELSNGGGPRLYAEKALSLPNLDNVDCVDSSFGF